MCAVLCPHVAQGGAGDPVFELEEALLRRGVDILRCRDAYDAMAELVLHEAARREGRSHDPLIVILVEPAKHGEAARSLYEAARRHAPHAAFWGYETGPSPRLAAYAPPASTPQASAATPTATAAAPLTAQAKPRVMVRPIGSSLAGSDSAGSHSALENQNGSAREAREDVGPARPTLRLAGENSVNVVAGRGEANGSAPRVHGGRATAQSLTHEELEMLTRDETPTARAVAPGG